MKKVIKLTEKDLTRIIKRVIMEADGEPMPGVLQSKVPQMPGGKTLPEPFKCIVEKSQGVITVDKLPQSCQTSIAADMKSPNLLKCIYEMGVKFPRLPQEIFDQCLPKFLGM